MNKSELIKKISDDLLITQTDAREVLDCLFDNVTECLGNGEKVTITGFGSLNLIKRAARKARNPQTGVEIDVPSKTVVSFTSSGKLKDKVNG